MSDHRLMIVALDETAEAHYLCGALNSAPCDLMVRSYTVSTQISTHVLDNVAIPKFDPGDEAHQLAAEEDQEKSSEVEEEIDRAAAKLWDLSDEELAAIQQTLADLS